MFEKLSDNWEKEYQELPKLEQKHIFDGIEYTAPEINKDDVYMGVYETFEKNGILDQEKSLNGEISLSPDLLASSVLDYAMDNSKLFCGVSEDGSEHIDVNKQETEEAKKEFLDIIHQLIVEQTGTKIPDSLADVFDKNHKPTVDETIKRAYRGMVTANVCLASEGTNQPEIAGLMHVSSVLLYSYINKDSQLNQIWNDEYLEDGISEGNGPKTIGAVDAIVAVALNNKEKYPVLDKFFSTVIDIGGEQCSFYDFVDYLK